MGTKWGFGRLWQSRFFCAVYTSPYFVNFLTTDCYQIWLRAYDTLDNFPNGFLKIFGLKVICHKNIKIEGVKQVP